PTVVDVPTQKLLPEVYNADRRSLAVGQANTGLLHPGSLGGRAPTLANAQPLPAVAANDSSIWETTVPITTQNDLLPSAGRPAASAEGVIPADSCRVDVIDRWGSVVSATLSEG